MAVFVSRNESSDRLLVTRYSVDPREVGELRWVQKPGTLADKDIRLVRVFDPRTLTLGAPNIRTYDGLDSYPELVQFQGHIDGNNALYLSNRSTQDLSASPESG